MSFSYKNAINVRFVLFRKNSNDSKIYNKKVLLHERKRHTTCCIASAHYADLSPDGGGTPSSPGWVGVVPHPVLDGWYLTSPQWGYPHPVPTGGTPIQSSMGVPWGTLAILILDRGIPPISRMGEPPLHPDLGWGNLPPISRMEYAPSGPGMGYPPHLIWDGYPLIQT